MNYYKLARKFLNAECLNSTRPLRMTKVTAIHRYNTTGLTYLCFGFKFEYLLKVVSNNFPKCLSISLLLWGLFCTASFPIKWDENEKILKKKVFSTLYYQVMINNLEVDTLPTNFDYCYKVSKSTLIKFSKRFY